MEVRPDLQAFTRFEMDFKEIFGFDEKSSDSLYKFYWQRVIQGKELSFIYKNKVGYCVAFDFFINVKESKKNRLIHYLDYAGFRECQIE